MKREDALGQAGTVDKGIEVMTNKNLEIIYEDHALVVCHKLPGIPVQTAKIGKPDMVSLLRNYFAGKGEKNTQVFVVHRLDQPVEGVMVFARTKQAAAKLSCQSGERSMEKCYLALAEGVFKERSGILENYLLHNKKENISCVVQQCTSGAKLARLSYEVQKVYQAEELQWYQKICKRESNQPARCVSLVRVQLETGRHHQIRVQMSYAGHPLIGDKKYNQNCLSFYLPVGLCAVKIAFTHPVTGKQMEFSVKPKGDSFRMPENIM